jgi:hypothetical protein
VFREKEFNLVVSPIHPPLGDIKVLSMLPVDLMSAVAPVFPPSEYIVVREG